MRTNHTMKSIKSIIVLALLVVYLQNTECKSADAKSDNELRATALAKQYGDFRGLREVWDQVKNSAINSWNFIKKVAANTREKILQWADSARAYAVQVEKSFEEQLKVLRQRLDHIITDLLGTGKLVQECLKKEGKNVQDVLKGILLSMSECISNQLKQLGKIQGKEAQLSVNDTLFISELDNKLEACENEKANFEECLYTVRGLVYDEIEELDNHIQNANIESRSLADDIRNTLSTCSLQNLAEASSYLTSEMMEIVRCVLDSKGINEAILE